MRRAVIGRLGRAASLACALAAGAATAAAQEAPAEVEVEPDVAPEVEAPPPTPPLSPVAAEHIARGTALFDRQHYDAALTEFLAAHEVMAGHPLGHQVLYNIAFCYERSFRYDEAIRFYERYLAEGGGADAQATEVRAVLGSLAELLGTVRVEAAVDGFEVWIDDHHVGDGAAPIRLPAGMHTIEVRAERHLPARREARVLAGQETRVAIELERVDAFRGLPPVAFVVSGSLTLATLAAGLSVGLASLLEGQALRARLAEPSGWRVTTEEVEDLERLSLTADVLYGAAALAGVVSVVLLAMTRWDDGGDGLSLAPGGLRGRF